MSIQIIMLYVSRWFFVFFLLVSCTGAPLETEQEPLLLTPYIKEGEMSKARAAARNPTYFGKKESYSGFLTVNKTTETNLFFWYFTAEKAPSSAPVVLWLQGGPGASSLFGAFLENGPYEFDQSKSTVKFRKYYWSEHFHMVYIDNPAGAGYSFTEQNDYAKNECQIGMNLYDAMTQFFSLFPELRRNKFYVTGESYAGKYVPSLAHYIHINNPNATNDTRINLRGIALGNAIIDPITQLDNGDVYYQLGLLDDEGLKQYKQIVQKAKDYIKAQSWEQATSMYFKLMDITYDASGFQTLYNFLKDKDDLPLHDLENFLDYQSAKQALHAGTKGFSHHRPQAFDTLVPDRTKSVKNWFREVLENYDVLLYNGQLDLNKPYIGMVHFMNQLNWSGSSNYRKAPRTIWRVKGRVAGYSKTVIHSSQQTGRPIKFSEILLRNAGHLAPRDQPLWAMEMMMNFTGTRHYHFLFTGLHQGAEN